MERTEILQNDATEIASPVGEADRSSTLGILQVGEDVGGWEIKSKLPVKKSGEAELYYAQKDGETSVVKIYRTPVNPKVGMRQEEILNKIKGLNHPDIVNLYTFGTHKGRLFEIMEYAKGGAIDSTNEDGSYKYLPLSEKEVIGVCKEVINAFKACHEKGVIHRDIKPANLYYRDCEEITDKKGKFKGEDIVIADFGISSVMDESEQYHKTTTASRTSTYAPPEVDFGEINFKFDYYSLGVTLWELATGKTPFLDENDRRLDPIYIMQRATQGYAADDLLSTKPLLSEKLQRLIRGLLVVNPDHRWGYEQVTNHLAGKEVEIRTQEKTLKFPIGDRICTSFEELSEAIMEKLVEKPEVIFKTIFQGHLAAALSRSYPKLAKDIEEIAEKASAEKNPKIQYNGISKIAWTLNPKTPFKFRNNYSADSLEQVKFLIANAPETMLPLLRDRGSRFYVYLEVLLKQTEQTEKIKEIAPLCGDAELIAKTLIILEDRKLEPYKTGKYQGFSLDTPETLLFQSSENNIPEDLQNRILLLIAEENYEGLIYPWIDLHLKERGISKYAPKTWKDLMDLFEKAA